MSLSAYRSGNSAETALMKMMNDIYRHNDAGAAVELVARDVSAAFDAVNQAILFERLNTEFGIDGLPLQWIASYPAGRTCIVQIGASSSAIVVNTIGVPQGSVLGPILFTS